MRMSLVGVLTLVSLAGITLSPVQAARFEGRGRYRLPDAETVTDNLYVGGGNVEIGGIVERDLIMGGGNILMAGEVRQDAFLAGGSVNVRGEVDGDLRAAGGSVTVTGPVGGELVIAGGSVVVEDGIVRGDVVIAGGDVFVSTTIEGDLRIHGGKLTLGPRALIHGNLVYDSPQEAVIEPGAIVEGSTEYTPREINRDQGKTIPGIFVIWQLVRLISLILLTFLIYYLWNQGVRTFVENSTEHLAPNILRGLTLLIIIPVSIILLFITIIGIIPGIIGLLLYIASLFVTHVFSAFVFAGLFTKHVLKKPAREFPLWNLILAVFLIYIIGRIPFLGWIIVFILFLASFGAIWKFIYYRFREPRFSPSNAQNV